MVDDYITHEVKELAIGRGELPPPLNPCFHDNLKVFIVKKQNSQTHIHILLLF